MGLSAHTYKVMKDYMFSEGNEKLPRGVKVLSKDKDALSSFMYKEHYYGSIRGNFFVEGSVVFEDDECVIVRYHYGVNFMDSFAKYDKSTNLLVSHICAFDNNERCVLKVDKNHLLVVDFYGYSFYVFLYRWVDVKSVKDYTVYNRFGSPHEVFLCNKEGVSYIASKQGIFSLEELGHFEVIECHLDKGYIHVKKTSNLEEYHISFDGSITPVDDELTPDECRRIARILMKLSKSGDERFLKAIGD